MLHFNRIFAVAPLLLLLSACGAGHTIVSTPPAAVYHAETVALAYDTSTVDVPEEDIAKMGRFIEQRLFEGKNAKFRPGDDLTVKWSFIGYDPGSQFIRWFIGFGAGEAQMVVRADFYDRDGAKIASIQADGTVSAGFFGGSTDDALKNVANQIALYAERTFR